MNRWSKEEVEDLKKLYNKLDNNALIEHFDRSYLSIYKKARNLGMYKSKEIAFINRSKARSGENASNWNGGKKKNKAGYVLVLDKDHPRASVNGYVLEHVKVMSNHIGRPVGLDEAVHHKNGIKSDNRIENLELMGFGEHTSKHHTGLKRSKETRRKMSEKAKERYIKRSVVNE